MKEMATRREFVFFTSSGANIKESNTRVKEPKILLDTLLF